MFMNAWNNSWIGICYRDKNGDHHPGRSIKRLGHIMFSAIFTAPLNEAKGIRLVPGAVRPDLQSQRIDSGLIREGLCFCKELEYD